MRSVIAKFLPTDIENAAVAGPSRMPTPAFPNRPMLSLGTENASLLNHAAVVWLVGIALMPETTSGRCCETLRCRGFVPEGSTAALKYGVRNGPVCSRVIPVTRQPPTSRFAPRDTLLANF